MNYIGFIHKQIGILVDPFYVFRTVNQNEGHKFYIPVEINDEIFNSLEPSIKKYFHEIWGKRPCTQCEGHILIGVLDEIYHKAMPNKNWKQYHKIIKNKKLPGFEND